MNKLTSYVYSTLCTITVCMILFTRCANLDDEALPVIPTTQLTFQKSVKPILDTRCVECHSRNNPSAGYALDSYLGVLERGSDNVPNAIAGNTDSKIIAQLESGHFASDDDVVTIRNWIVSSQLALADPDVHESGFNDVDSPNFHGRVIRNAGWDWGSCTECHGTDLEGGAVEKSCSTCHNTPLEDCTTCHGGYDNSTGAPPEDLNNNILTSVQGVGAHTAHLDVGRITVNAVECIECHIVPDDYNDSEHLDGDNIAEVMMSGLAEEKGANPVWDRTTATCANVYCHGTFSDTIHGAFPSWTGGQAEAACGTCHALPPVAETSTGEIHPNYNKCEICHDAVAGVDQSIQNLSLHVNGTVEYSQLTNGCASCHGTDGLGAPGPDLDGNTEFMAPGVGAHAMHLAFTRLTSNQMECTDCHQLPVDFDYKDPVHLDGDNQAEVKFAGLALEQDTDPAYDHTAKTCTNVYCHGGFAAGNAENAPIWNGGSDEAACGTCHGMPPPQFPVTRIGITHPPFIECYVCHGDVVDENNNIIDKSLHINGLVEFN